MRQKIFHSMLFIVLCLAFGISEAHVIVVDTNNTYKNVGAESNIDVTNYEKCTLANGKEIYTLKQNTSSKIMNAEEAELVNVTFLCSYDGTSMVPGELITVNGDNFSGDLWMEQDWMTGIYSLTTQLPAGTYDFCSYGYYISDKGLLYNVKELVQINNDTTITFDFSESNIKYNFKTIKPNGEEATLDACVFDEDLLLYTVVKPGNTISFTDDIFLILKGSDYLGGYVGPSYGPSSKFEVLGENPSATIYLNNVSNRYKLVSMRMLEDENDIYIVKYESTDMSETLIQNNPENFVLYEEDFASLGSDNTELYQGFRILEMIDNVRVNGNRRDHTMPILNPVTKVYVDPNVKDRDESNRFDILIQPLFKDNVFEDQLNPRTGYDEHWNPIEIIDTVSIYRTIIGLPVMINNDGSVEYVNTGHDGLGNHTFHIPEGGGKLIEYPGHPQFSYISQQKALPDGSNCPITSVMAQNTENTTWAGTMKYSGIQPCFIGRYGEIIDSYYSIDIKYNGETICDNCLTIGNDLSNFAYQGNPDGVMTAHFENTNAVVDGLQGKNVTDVYFDQRQEDWTAPTLQMLLFKDTEGNIIDRFETAEEGILEFAGGDFNFHQVSRVFWFDCKEQTVEVSYSPYSADDWAPLEVNEIPEEYYMPGFGFFYRGSLRDVAGRGEKGWFDLKIKLTDLSGNWQEQVISPAFRIGDGSLTGIEAIKNDTATEVARYTIDGRTLSAPQTGVNIVKMSDGTVKKVLVK